MKYLNILNLPKISQVKDFIVNVNNKITMVDSWSELILEAGKSYWGSSNIYGAMPLQGDIGILDGIEVLNLNEIDSNKSISDPETASAVLRSHRSACPYQVTEQNAVGFESLRQIYPELQLNDGIFWCDPEHTKIYRHLLLHYITPKAVEGWRSEVRSLAKAELEDAGVIMDPAITIPQLACRAVCQCLLGYKGDVNILSSAIEFLISSDAVWRWRLAPDVALRMSVNAIFEDAEEGYLVDVMRKGGFSDSQIKAMIISLVFAGQLTTSAVLTHAVHATAESIDIRNRFRMESVNEPEKAIKTLNRFILESLRMSSPTPSVERDYVGMKGKVIVNIAEMSRCPHLVGDQSNQFDPERDLFDQMPGFLPNLPWFPFGAPRGAHTCVGWRFFFMEAQEFVQEFWLNHNAVQAKGGAFWLSNP